MEKITPQELLNKIKSNEEVFILDVRAEEKYQNGTISEDNLHVVNVPWTLLKEVTIEDEILNLLPKDKPIVTLCTSGNSATLAASLLNEKGYNASPLEGGLTAWNEAKK